MQRHLRRVAFAVSGLTLSSRIAPVAPADGGRADKAPTGPRLQIAPAYKLIAPEPYFWAERGHTGRESLGAAGQ